MLTTQQEYQLLYKKFDAEKHEGVPVCPLCGQRYRKTFQEQSLQQHISRAHRDIEKEYQELLEAYEQARHADHIACPLCNKVHSHTLHRHIKDVHGYSSTAFRQMFPKVPITLKRCKQQKAPGTKTPRVINPKILECQICFKFYSNLKDHVVRSHKYTWENYCKEFGWDITLKAIHSEAHNKKVAQGKKLFYASEAGYVNKMQISKRVAGENNPSKSAVVRQKISYAQAKYWTCADNNFLGPRGLHVRCDTLGVHKHFRSFTEFKVAYTLFINDIRFLYEPEAVKLSEGTKASYIPDFILDQNPQEFFEIKANRRQIDVEKYVNLKKSLAAQRKQLYITDYKGLCLYLRIQEMPDAVLYDFCRQQLLADKMHISCLMPANRRSRILYNITPEYKNYKNIDYKELKVRKDMETETLYEN